MATTTITRNEFAKFSAVINEAMKNINKMKSFKAAQAEYKSLSHVLKEMKAMFSVEHDGVVYGYYEALKTVGVTDSSMLTPILLKGLHSDLSTMVDGKAVDGYYITKQVYKMVDGATKKIYARDADGNMIPEMNEDGVTKKTITVFKAVRSYTPALVITILQWDKALRTNQFYEVLKAKNKELPNKDRLSVEDMLRMADQQYLDYVSAKFKSKQNAPISENKRKKSSDAKKKDAA